MNADMQAYAGGFTDAARQSQAVFRRLLDAMAQPGTLRTMDPEVVAPAPVNAASAAVLLTLADADVTVWLGDDLCGNDALKAWIAFHCGSRAVSGEREADFVLCCDPLVLPELRHFRAGTQDYPDRSATIVLDAGVLSATARDGLAGLRLEGPGIAATNELHARTLPKGFLGQWQANGALFPRGIDMILTGIDAASGKPVIACLPRTVRISGTGG
ncbi:MAG: phosphonate C-P lyase system protein PhnH [Phyllobacteriaceae bacterium]|nr:phosphonate C-P lyase system protein PhnH [Phyllobacteriaceae bacterium]MBA90592.1 phosphonate C-P lyase system protein PhnH [Phyllobacteriaceae bacterium]